MYTRTSGLLSSVSSIECVIWTPCVVWYTGQHCRRYCQLWKLELSIPIPISGTGTPRRWNSVIASGPNCLSSFIAFRSGLGPTISRRPYSRSFGKSLCSISLNTVGSGICALNCLGTDRLLSGLMMIGFPYRWLFNCQYIAQSSS